MITGMIPRRLAPVLRQRLDEAPAVVLVGPRQVGKTTLALAEGEVRGAEYIDLESDRDRARLSEPELYLPEFFGRLVILDEIHRTPGLFPVLRGLIDRARREGHRSGQYLLLGSASLDLMRQSGESLAGRVGYLELPPLDVLETAQATAQEDLWLRGGFPDSLRAADDGASLRWREDFIRIYLERDIPQFGPRIATEALRRFWGLLALHHGSLLNAAQLARGVGIDAKTAASYLDLLVDLFLVRRLPAWHANVGKRLVKSPKVYIRDSGLLHALLGVTDRSGLLGHAVVGASWEGFVIENLLAAVGDRATGHFYRTASGAEIDLLLVWPDGRRWAIEVKRALDPRPRRGFHVACADLAPAGRFVVYPGDRAFPLGEGIEAVPLAELMRRLSEVEGRG